MVVVRNSQKEFVPAPAGLHHAVCVDEIDLGMEDTAYGRKPKVRLVWQIEERNPEDGKRFLVIKKYSQTIAPKSRLRHDLESWRGRPMTAAEEVGFDLANVVGANCQLNIEHVVGHGRDGIERTYANISAIVPAPKGAEKLVPEDYVRWKDRAENQGKPNAGERQPGQDEEVPF